MYFAVSFIHFPNVLSFLCREYRNFHFLTEFSMILSSLDLDRSYSTSMKIYFLSPGIHRGWPNNELSWKTHEEETIYSIFVVVACLLFFSLQIQKILLSFVHSFCALCHSLSTSEGHLLEYGCSKPSQSFSPTVDMQLRHEMFESFNCSIFLLAGTLTGCFPLQSPHALAEWNFDILFSTNTHVWESCKCVGLPSSQDLERTLILSRTDLSLTQIRTGSFLNQSFSLC